MHLAAPLRVAKMQDVRSLLVFRFAAKLSLTHSFSLRGCGSRRRFARRISQQLSEFSGSCLHMHLAAPLRVAKMQDVRSLLVFRFAAKLSLTHSFSLRGCGSRRRFARRISQQLSEFSGSCSHIHLAAPLRVAKMQDVRSLPVFRFAAKLSLHHNSSVVHTLFGQSAYSDGAGRRGRKKAERMLRFFVFCCFDAFTSWQCTRKAP